MSLCFENPLSCRTFDLPLICQCMLTSLYTPTSFTIWSSLTKLWMHMDMDRLSSEYPLANTQTHKISLLKICVELCLALCLSSVSSSLGLRLLRWLPGCCIRSIILVLTWVMTIKREVTNVVTTAIKSLPSHAFHRSELFEKPRPYVLKTSRAVALRQSSAINTTGRNTRWVIL